MNILNRIIQFVLLICIYFVGSLLILSELCTTETLWLSNVFSDKMYVFELTPLFLFIISYIDKCITIPVLTRIGKRSTAIVKTFCYKWSVAFIYICIWFIIVNVITYMKYPYLSNQHLLYILGYFIRYILGFILASIISQIIGMSENKNIADNSYLCTFIFLVIELIVIVPEIKINTRYKPSFLFSWIFCEGNGGYIALVVIIFLLLIYLWKLCIGKDIL